MSDPAVIAPNRRVIAGFLLALSNFMVVLDLTIANVSVPHIAGNLGISLEQGTWIVTSYAVAEAICVPLTGWLVLRFGAVRTFLFAMSGFAIFSLLCGLSVSLGMIVAFRIGQGLCGGPIMPVTQALLVRIFPPDQRNKAIGLWAMTTLMGPAMGPVLGGLISDGWSWHWIFFINVPLAIGTVFGGMLLLRKVETPTQKHPIDVIGLVLLTFWVGCLQIMLDIGRDHGWFDDTTIILLAIGAVLGFVVFIIWELTEEHPAVDLRVFRHRGYSASVATLALCFGAYFASIVVIPQWLQSSMGYDATRAGLITAFTGMMALTMAPLATKMMMHVDVRIMVSGGVAWIGCMALARTMWTSGADFWTLAMPQILQGLAMPFFMVPLTQASLSSVEPHETASAAGLQNAPGVAQSPRRSRSRSGRMRNGPRTTNWLTSCNRRRRRPTSPRQAFLLNRGAR